MAVVRHKGGGAENRRKGSPVSSLAPRRLENASKMMEVASSTTKSLTTSSVNHEDAEEDEETQFQLSRDGYISAYYRTVYPSVYYITLLQVKTADAF